MDVTAKIVKMMPAINGEGKNGNKWVKQEIIVETLEDQYPRKICISFWGEKCNELGKYAIGDVVKIFINIESREYNERWYTDVRAWKLELVQKVDGTTPPINGSIENDVTIEPSMDYNGLQGSDGGEKYNDLPF